MSTTKQEQIAKLIEAENNLTFFGVKVTRQQAEIIISMPKRDADSDEYPHLSNVIEIERLKLSCVLIPLLMYGSPSIAKDPKKARELDNIRTDGNTTIDENSVGFNTKGVYFTFSFVNSTRLFVLRCRRLIEGSIRYSLGRETFSKIPAFGIVMSGLSLMFAGELIFEGIVVISNVFFADERTKKHNPISTWQRFLNTFFKDNRPTRTANAAIWLTINLAYFVVSQTINKINNIIGFGLDVVIAFYLYQRDTRLRIKLIKNTEKHLEQLKKEKMHKTDEYLALQRSLRDFKNEYSVAKYNSGYSLAIACAVFVGCWLFSRRYMWRC